MDVSYLWNGQVFFFLFFFFGTRLLGDMAFPKFTLGRRMIEHGDNPEYRRASLIEQENHDARSWYRSLPVGELNQLKEYVLR